MLFCKNKFTQNRFFTKKKLIKIFSKIENSRPALEGNFLPKICENRKKRGEDSAKNKK